MAIDDPKAAFEQQYMQEEGKSPLGLSIFIGKLAFPKAALPLEIFRKVVERFTRASVEERQIAMYNMLVRETEHLEPAAVRSPPSAHYASLQYRRAGHYPKTLLLALGIVVKVRHIFSEQLQQPYPLN